MRRLLPDDVQLQKSCTIYENQVSLDQAGNVHNKFILWVPEKFSPGTENLQLAEPMPCWDMIKEPKRMRWHCTDTDFEERQGTMSCIPSCLPAAFHRSVSPYQPGQNCKVVLLAHVRPGAFECQTRLEERTPQHLSNASFLGVVNSDTPQCSYCFPEQTIMTMVPMTVDIPRSQIMAFNVRLRLPSHATKVGIHVATAPKDSQVAHRKEFWSGAPRTCTCKMVGIPDIARKERSFRHQRVFLRTFSISANSSMVKMIFWRNSVHWQFLEKCAAFPFVQTSFSTLWLQPW